MKKILVLVSSIVMLVNVLEAQDVADKKFRFGLRIMPTPTWLRSNELKLISKSSTKFGFGFGLQMEARINSTASFVFGVGGDFLGGKQVYDAGQGYVLSKDDEYVDSKKVDFTTGAPAIMASGDKLYELKSRSVSATYVTIPVLLKLMTKDISGFKYFGVFGGNIAVQTKYKATDEIAELVAIGTGTATMYNPTAATRKVSDLRPSGDLIPFNVGLNVGIGAEYNLSGSTSIFFSVNYLRGFINQYQKTSETIVDKIKENVNAKTKPANSKQSAFSDAIQINIGVLF